VARRRCRSPRRLQATSCRALNPGPKGRST
jgi:hypothetical protein